MDTSKKPQFLQIFVRLLHGKSAVLTFAAPQAFGYQIKQRIFDATKIPTDVQRLICGGYQVDDAAVISQPESTIHLSTRLRGGKGGLRSLLRGAPVKAGQKKLNNLESCRDISGRRLRQVNMVKRLEEWKMEEEDRELEKIAEEFIKKKQEFIKKVMKSGAEKYVEEYREESAKCVEELVLAVREACGSEKRKAKVGKGAGEAKRLKIWTGNRELADSDNDSDESSSDDE